MKKKKESEQCDQEVKLQNIFKPHKETKHRTGCEEVVSRFYFKGYLLLLGFIKESPRNETVYWMLDWLGVKNVTSGFIFKVICCYRFRLV